MIIMHSLGMALKRNKRQNTSKSEIRRNSVEHIGFIIFEIYINISFKNFRLTRSFA